MTTEVIEQTQEERDATEREAEARFAAGYAKAKGKAEPEKGTKTEPAEDIAAAPEKSDAERQAEAKAKQEADAKAAVEKAWDGVPAVVREKLQSLDALTGTVSKLAGHIGGLTNATQRIETALKAGKEKASTAGGDTPSDKEVKSALKDPEAWAKLKEDFPDWAGPVETELAALRGEIAAKEAPKIDQEAIVSEAEERAFIRFKHPDWKATLKTKEFGDWWKAQPDDFRALGASEQAEDTIKVLDTYKAHSGQVAADAQKRQQQEKRLQRAVVPEGSGATHEAGISDQEAFERGYKRAAKRR